MESRVNFNSGTKTRWLTINHLASGEAVIHVEESKNGEKVEKERRRFRLNDKHLGAQNDRGNKNPLVGHADLREEKYNDSRKEE